MPRNGTMLAGIDEVRPRLARVYAPPVMTTPSRMSPSSAFRRNWPIIGRPPVI